MARGRSLPYWQQLQQGMAENSPGAQAIQGGIDRARQRMIDAGQTPPEAPVLLAVKAQISIDPALRASLPDSASVFVFIREPNGPPMPLAAKRLTLAELPLELSLSEADAMLPGVKLSAEQPLELVARVSLDGDARSGTHIGRVDEVRAGSEQVYQLVIDQSVE